MLASEPFINPGLNRQTKYIFNGSKWEQFIVGSNESKK